MLIHSPRSTLFPYTTLFRSCFNTQDQPKLTWAASFVLARAYVDQLERSNGLSAERLKAVRQALDHAEKAKSDARRDALKQDRKSTRLNSSHVEISYAVFCLK